MLTRKQYTRTTVKIGDVKHLLNIRKPTYDTILLHVDNGPERLTHSDNNWINSLAGLQDIYEVLKPKGMLVICQPDWIICLFCALKKPATR